MIGTSLNDFGHDTTTDEVLEGIDLTGKLALVTGATSGLGAETARALASKGAHVVITARNLEKAERVVSDIKASTGNSDVEIEELELGSLASVRAFADRFLAKHDSLKILVNNAGVMACPQAKTEDGFELQFGTNHLGHFLLTGLIAPALLKAAPARIVALSSRGHQLSAVDFEDLLFEKRDYNKWISYGQSKTEVFQKTASARFVAHDGCKALILIMTAHSYDSDWIHNELNQAKRKQKNISSVLLDSDEPWLSVETTQYVDVRNGKLPPEYDLLIFVIWVK